MHLTINKNLTLMIALIISLITTNLLAAELPPAGNGKRYPMESRITDTLGEQGFDYLVTQPHNNPTASGRHDGLDIAWNLTGEKCGHPIYPIAPGRVVARQTGQVNGTGWGNYVRVYHESLGIFVLYAHLENNNIALLNEDVSTSRPLGRMGSTGYSTGCHLHIRGSTVNSNGFGYYANSLPADVVNLIAIISGGNSIPPYTTSSLPQTTGAPNWDWYGTVKNSFVVGERVYGLAKFSNVTYRHSFRAFVMNLTTGQWLPVNTIPVTDWYNGYTSGPKTAYTWPMVQGLSAGQYKMHICIQEDNRAYPSYCLSSGDYVGGRTAEVSFSITNLTVSGSSGEINLAGMIGSTQNQLYTLRQPKFCSTEPRWDGQGNFNCEGVMTVTEGSVLFVSFQVHGTNSLSLPEIVVDRYHSNSFMRNYTVRDDQKYFWNGGHFTYVSLGNAVIGAEPNVRIYVRQSTTLYDFVGRRDYAVVASIPVPPPAPSGESVRQIILDPSNAKEARVNWSSGVKTWDTNVPSITPVSINSLARIAYLKYSPTLIPENALSVTLSLFVEEKCGNSGFYQVSSMDHNFSIGTHGSIIGSYPSRHNTGSTNYSMPSVGTWVNIPVEKTAYGVSMTAGNSSFDSVCVGFAGPSTTQTDRRPKLLIELPVSVSPENISMVSGAPTVVEVTSPPPRLPTTLGCVDGSVEQVFSVYMVGCNGSKTQRQAKTLCGVGWLLATPTIYVREGGSTIVPNTTRFLAGCLRDARVNLSSTRETVCSADFYDPYETRMNSDWSQNGSLIDTATGGYIGIASRNTGACHRTGSPNAPCAFTTNYGSFGTVGAVCVWSNN